mgnify:CR=1 FL=1
MNFCPLKMYLNVVRCAHNVEWDFFCDFQTPCLKFPLMEDRSGAKPGSIGQKSILGVKIRDLWRFFGSKWMTIGFFPCTNKIPGPVKRGKKWMKYQWQIPKLRIIGIQCFQKSICPKMKKWRKMGFVGQPPLNWQPKSWSVTVRKDQWGTWIESCVPKVIQSIRNIQVKLKK